MLYGYYDWYSYVLFILPALIVAIAAQVKLKSTYSKYNKVHNARGLTAAVVARSILDSNGLHHVKIEKIGGQLSDHFDPKANVVRLSEGVYESTSISAAGVAAHEVGHAIQYAQEYKPIQIRNFILPATRIGSFWWAPLFLIGLIFTIPAFTYIGIFLFASIAIFQLVTLPVEYNASHRALETLQSDQYLTEEERFGAEKVLNAAALTYVAALLMSLLQLIRLLLLSNRNR